MTAPTTKGQEGTMSIAKLKITVGLTLAALVASLAVATGASARVMPEPGSGSPVTHQHRSPSVKKAIRRSLGGYPSRSGQHVKSLKELATE
jgi:hypothetical protein